MGMAYAKSFLQYDLVKKENLLLVEKNTERMDALHSSNTGVVTGVIDALLGKLRFTHPGRKAPGLQRGTPGIARSNATPSTGAFHYGWYFH